MATQPSVVTSFEADVQNPEEAPTRNWKGPWSPDSFGVREVRPFTASVDDGFGHTSYLGGIDVSYQGGEPSQQWSDESFASAQDARFLAANMMIRWHRAQEINTMLPAEAAKLQLNHLGDLANISIEPSEADKLLQDHLSYLAKIDKGDHEARQKAASVIGEMAELDASYRALLESQDPAIATETRAAYLAERAVQGREENPLDLAFAISNAAELLTLREADSMGQAEAAALVKADLSILAMIDQDQTQARHHAASAIADVAEHHAAYKAALDMQDPSVADEIRAARIEDAGRSQAKEERKANDAPKPLVVNAGMTAATDKAGSVYLVELTQHAVHLVSQDGQRVVVGQGEKGKGLFLTRPDGHFDVVGTTQESIQAFIDRRQLYPLEGAAIAKMAAENGIYTGAQLGPRDPHEEAPLAVEIRNSRGERGYAIAIDGRNGEPGVQFHWSPTSTSEIYSSIGELEVAAHAAQLRPSSILDTIELAQVVGLPGKPFEQDLRAAPNNIDVWERMESVPDAYMRANPESGMAEVKEEGAITPVSGLAAIERWSIDHGASTVDKEHLVALDLEAARGRAAAAEPAPSEQLESIQLQGPAKRIGTTMPKPDWIETIQLLKARDPDAPAKVYIPKAGAEYGGQLLMVTDTHVIQRIGKGIAVAHDLAKMTNRESMAVVNLDALDSGKVKRGMEMHVAYGQDRGNARFFDVDPQHVKSVQRELSSWGEKNIADPRAREVYMKHVAAAALEAPKNRNAGHRPTVSPRAPARDAQISR